MTTVTITEDGNIEVVDIKVVNLATTTDSGLMSSSDKSKLDGIESSADVTDATNVEAAGAVMETDTSTTDMQFVVDEDNMVSDSATKIPTQQSVKAYVDSQISSKDELSELSGDLDDISDGTNHVKMTNAERTKLTGIETGATADQTNTEIKSLYESNADTNAFTDSLQTKLTNIEANATADQTDAEIKTAYENNSDTNAFTDAEKTKLSGVEAGATADQSASEILTAIKTVDGTTSGLDADLLDGQEGSYYQQASTALNTTTSFGGDVSGTYNAIVVADDSHNHIISNVDGLQTSLDTKAPLASPALTGTPTAPTAAADDSTTQVATTAFVQQELAQLVDSAPSTLDTLNEIAAAINDDANFNTTVTNSLANRLRVDTASQGLTSTQQNNAKTNLALDDVATSGAYSDLSGTPTNATTTTDGLMSSSDKAKLDAVEASATADQTDAEIKTAYENNANTNAFTDAEQTKLTGIEANATADQTASEIRTLVETATDSNVFTDADHTKLSGIESNATADQSAAEILTAIKTVDGTTSGLDADLLDGQEGSHYLDYNNFTNTPSATSPNNSTITLQAGSDLTGGGNFTLNQATNQTITFDHADTSSLSGTYGDTLSKSKINEITLDSNGHVTAITVGSTGDVDAVYSGVGLSGGGDFGSLTLNLDFSELTDMTADISGTTEFILQDGSTESRKAASEIKLSAFNNDSGFITSADGGNADRVDGLHAYQFLRSDVGDSAAAGITFYNNMTGTNYGSGNNLSIFFDGTTGRMSGAGSEPIAIQTDSDLKITKRNSAETMAVFNADGAVELHHDNSKKFETTSTGATVTGTLVADGISVGDNEDISVGGNDDLAITHNGTNSYISNKTGDLYIGGNNSGDVGGDLYLRAKIGETDTQIRLQDDQGISFYSNGQLVIDMGSTVLWFYKDTTVQSGASLTMNGGDFIFDTGTYDITVTPTTATADRTITLPDETGTLALTSSDITGNAATATNADTVDNKHIAVVSALPASPDSNTIYFIT
jgi:hypothetical protein